MSLLVDTNVLSETRRRIADPHVVAWSLAQDPTMLFISSISILEIEQGVLRMERKDMPQGLRLRRWMQDRVLEGFDGRILPLDAAVARRCAALHVPDKRPERDAMIAATALVHGLTVVTRNTADFAPMGVALFNPWLPAAQ